MMNPLLCVIPYCGKEAGPVRLLLEWIAELGGCDAHHCLLVVDSKVEKNDREWIRLSAENCFSTVESIEFQEGTPPKGLRWPIWRYWANQMFLLAANHIGENCRLPFLWLEADATPTKAGWLDEIANAYYSQPKRFMGPIILNQSADRPAYWPERHMAGVAVYPMTAVNVLRKWCGPETTWDLGGGPDVVPKASKTRLIQHFYGVSEAEAWSFKCDDGRIVGQGGFSPREDAVLFHRCKDGSLIKCLRELKQCETAKYPEKPELIGAAEDFAAMASAVVINRPKRVKVTA